MIYRNFWFIVHGQDRRLKAFSRHAQTRRTDQRRPSGRAGARPGRQAGQRGGSRSQCAAGGVPQCSWKAGRADGFPQ